MATTVVKDSQLRLDPIISQLPQISHPTEPSLRWREEDEAIDDDGLWRIRVQGGEVYLEANSAAAGDFSTIGIGGIFHDEVVRFTNDKAITTGGVRFGNFIALVNASGDEAKIRFTGAVGTAQNLCLYRHSSRPAHLEFGDAGTVGHILIHYDDIITNEVPSGTKDGVNKDFVVTNSVDSASEMVFLNGLLQQRGGSDDYTISGSTITFNTAPISTDVILVTYQKAVA